MSKPFCKDPNLTQKPPTHSGSKVETSAKNCTKETQRTMAKQQQHALLVHVPYVAFLWQKGILAFACHF
jgi:hypothetical protein